MGILERKSIIEPCSSSVTNHFGFADHLTLSAAMEILVSLYSSAMETRFLTLIHTTTVLR
jgi:hypothetical protein